MRTAVTSFTISLLPEELVLAVLRCLAPKDRCVRGAGLLPAPSSTQHLPLPPPECHLMLSKCTKRSAVYDHPLSQRLAAALPPLAPCCLACPPARRHRAAPTCRLWHQLVQCSRGAELVEVQGDHAILASFQSWMQHGGMQHVRRLQLSARVRPSNNWFNLECDRQAVRATLAQLDSLLGTLSACSQLAELELRPPWDLQLDAAFEPPSSLRRLMLAPANEDASVDVNAPLRSLTGLQYLRFGGRAAVRFAPASAPPPSGGAALLPPSLRQLVISPYVAHIVGLKHGVSVLQPIGDLDLMRCCILQHSCLHAVLPSRPSTSPQLAPRPMLLSQLAGLSNLVHLELGCMSVDEEDLKDVASMLPRLTRLDLSLPTTVPAWLGQLGGSLQHLRLASIWEADAAAIDGGLLAPLSLLTCLDLELDFPRRLQALPLAGGALPSLARVCFEHHGEGWQLLAPASTRLPGGPWLASIRELDLPAELLLPNLALLASAPLDRVSVSFNLLEPTSLSDSDEEVDDPVFLVCSPADALAPEAAAGLAALLAWAAAHPHLAHLHFSNLIAEPSCMASQSAPHAAIADARQRNPRLHITWFESRGLALGSIG